MRYILFILLIACSFACTSNNDVIPLYNNYFYTLQAGEQVLDANAETLEKYKNRFSFETVQIPLFKKIKTKHYEQFIGIPFQTNLLAISTQFKDRSTNFIIHTETDSSAYCIYKKQDVFLSEFAFSPDSSLTIYIATIYQDSTAILSEEALLKRIQK